MSHTNMLTYTHYAALYHPKQIVHVFGMGRFLMPQEMVECSFARQMRVHMVVDVGKVYSASRKPRYTIF